MNPRLAAACAAFLASLGVIAAAGFGGRGLAVPGIVLLVAVVAAFRFARFDVALRVYVIGLSVPFVVAPLYRNGFGEELGGVWWLLAVWLLGWGAGVAIAQLQRSHDHGPPPATARTWTIWPFMVVGGTGLFLQLLALLREETQFSAQLKGLVDTGPDALLLAATPAAIAVSFWASRTQARRRSRFISAAPAAALIAQTAFMTLSGFRGAAPSYLITVWLVGRRLDRRPGGVGRLAKAGTLAGVIIVIFLVASQQRSDIAASLGRNTGASRAVGLRELPEALAQRLDYSVFLRQAVQRSDYLEAEAVVSPAEQIKALVPRALWPSKPPVYYGRNVARVFFDVPEHYNSAETITWLGDLYVQGRAPLILAAGFAVGFLLSRALRIGSGTGLTGLIGNYALLNALFNIESPVLLAIGNSLRMFVVLYAAHWVGRLFQQEGRPAVPATALNAGMT